MKKLAANYTICDSGELLKNGIIVAEDDGSVLEYIDTKGELNEIARLAFYNGILLGGFNFVKVREAKQAFDVDSRFSSLVLAEISGMNEISIQTWLDICKKISVHFPEMKIIDIARKIIDIVSTDGGFRKENAAGIYLLTGSDLIVLKLTMNCRLKRIL